MTVEVKTSKGTFLWVEVPEDSHSHEVYENNVVGGWCLMFLRGNPDYACEYSPNFPPGQWAFLSTTKSITEGQAGEIVDKIEGRIKLKPYTDYEYPQSTTWTATESLRSLMEHNKLDVEKNWAILRKTETGQ